MSVSSLGLGSFFPTPRKPGQASRYLNGGGSLLARAPTEPDDAQQGEWPRKKLLKMDAEFCAAMERAISRGLERPPERNGYLTQRAQPAPACGAAPADSGSSTSPRRRASG
jgi:hypothetical protein